MKKTLSLLFVLLLSSTPLALNAQEYQPKGFQVGVMLHQSTVITSEGYPEDFFQYRPGFGISLLRHTTISGALGVITGVEFSQTNFYAENNTPATNQSGQPTGEVIRLSTDSRNFINQFHLPFLLYYKPFFLKDYAYAFGGPSFSIKNFHKNGFQIIELISADGSSELIADGPFTFPETVNSVVVTAYAGLGASIPTRSIKPRLEIFIFRDASALSSGTGIRTYRQGVGVRALIDL